jgi:hypothetical protein
MLAFYVPRENSGRKILLRARLARRVPLIPFRLSLARHARLTRLAVVASLRAAGWLPWVLAVGWVLFTVAQEPRLLRLHGIQLVGEAAWVAAIALAVVLGSSLRPSRSTMPYLFAITILTTIESVFATTLALGTEVVRGPSVVPVAVGLGGLLATLPPLAAFASLATARTDVLGRGLAVVGLILGFATIVRAAEAFSLLHATASIACFSSAAALAFGHCRKNA